MHKRIPSVIALLCVIVYVAAVLSAAFRVYLGIQRQSTIARGELEGLAALISGSGLLEEGSREQIRERIAGSRALEGVVITGSIGNELAFEREEGKIIKWNGNNPGFANRFGVVRLPAKQVDVPGLRNVNIYTAYSAVNYDMFISILKQTLIAVMCALLIAFLTMIIRYTMGDKVPAAEKAPAGKKAGKPAPAQAADNTQADDFGFDDFTKGTGGTAKEKPAEDAEETHMDDFGFADFMEDSDGNEAQTENFGFADFVEEPSDAAVESAGEEAAFDDDFSFDLDDGAAEASVSTGVETAAEDIPDFDDLFDDTESGGAAEATEEIMAETAPEAAAKAVDEDMPAFDDLFDDTENGASFAVPEEDGEEEESGDNDLLPGSDIEPEDGYIDLDIPLDGLTSGETASAAPAGVVPEEQMRDRLDSELERCTEQGDDLTVMFLECGENVACDETLYNKLAGEALDFFNLDGLTFEKGGRGISLIIPGGDLDGEIGRAGEFHAHVLKNFAGSFNEKTDFRIGLSSRSGRNVQSGRLLFEAANALKKAAEDQPIVAFRVDPEKYRQFILSHQG
jgi:hypothetical protein